MKIFRDFLLFAGWVFAGLMACLGIVFSVLILLVLGLHAVLACGLGLGAVWLCLLVATKSLQEDADEMLRTAALRRLRRCGNPDCGDYVDEQDTCTCELEPPDPPGYGIQDIFHSEL